MRRKLWPVTRRRVNPRARIRVQRLFIRKALEILGPVEIDEYFLCGDCPWHEERGDSACDFCGIPDMLAGVNDAIDAAYDILVVVERGGPWRER